MIFMKCIQWLPKFNNNVSCGRFFKEDLICAFYNNKEPTKKTIFF